MTQESQPTATLPAEMAQTAPQPARPSALRNAMQMLVAMLVGGVIGGVGMALLVPEITPEVKAALRGRFGAFTAPALVVLLLLVSYVGIAVHEAIHAVCFHLIGRVPREQIRFGIHGRTLTPYVGTSAAMPARAYRASAVASPPILTSRPPGPSAPQQTGHPAGRRPEVTGPSARRVRLRRGMDEIEERTEIELVATMANVAASTNAKEPATDGRPTSYLRTLLAINGESVFGRSSRLPTNRHNAYRAPGGLAALKSGLTSSNCAHAAAPLIRPKPS